nr:hypothetical protein [Gemmatimonadaceae bacterium]
MSTSAPPGAPRLLDAVARRLAMRPATDPVEARYQSLIATGFVAACLCMVLQAVLVAATETTPVRGVRLTAIGAYVASLAIGLAMLRRGRVAAAVAWCAIGGGAHMVVLVAAFGLQQQPHLLTVATVPAIVLGLFGSWRVLVAWSTTLVAALAVG